MVSILSDQHEQYTVEEGYSECATLARISYENFTIVSWLLPANKRKHLNALYAFCRYVDNIGDEYTGDRMTALAEWESDLRRCYDSVPIHPYMIALQDTIHRFDVPIYPFLDLITANRIDQKKSRYKTFEELKQYCGYSANPVGHLLLYIFGYRDEERQTLSDFTCTALQLTNFWQDVARDHDMGRIYIPKEDMERFGYTEDELAQHLVTESFRTLMKMEVARTREYFKGGHSLLDTLSGRFRLDVSLFGRGGIAILDAIERQNYDVLKRRPVLSTATKFVLMATTTAKLAVTGRI